MSKTITPKRPAGAATAKHETQAEREAARRASSGRRPRQKNVRKATNLTLDPVAVLRGETYRTQHGIGSLSQLVNTLLGALPSSEVRLAEFAPAVRRLRGAALPAPEAATAATGHLADDPRTAYREHLIGKYGGA